MTKYSEMEPKSPPHRITRERYEALMKDPLARPKLEIALEIGVFVIDDGEKINTYGKQAPLQSGKRR